MGIGRFTKLYCAQRMVEFCAPWAWLAVFADYVALVVLQVVNPFDWTDYCRRSASAGFFESGELLFGNGADFHFKAEVKRKLLKTVIGD